jgi:hypothetical protein
MSRRGTVLTYEVPTDLYVSPQELADKGYADFLPRNNYKSAFISALKKVYKDKEHFYRRFNDDSSSSTCSFACFVESRTENDIDVNKELVIHIDKKLGYITVDAEDELSEAKKDLLARVKEAYDKEQVQFNAEQFRRVIKNVLEQSYAVSIKKGSSVYFLDKKYDLFRDKIFELETHFPQISIQGFDMGSDEGALKTLDKNVREDVLGNVENLIKEFKKEIDEGTITNKKVQNKTEQINSIIEKAQAHAHNLLDEGRELLSGIKEISKRVESYEEKADVLTSNFLDDLASL